MLIKSKFDLFYFWEVYQMLTNKKSRKFSFTCRIKKQAAYKHTYMQVFLTCYTK